MKSNADFLRRTSPRKRPPARGEKDNTPWKIIQHTRFRTARSIPPGASCPSCRPSSTSASKSPFPFFLLWPRSRDKKIRKLTENFNASFHNYVLAPDYQRKNFAGYFRERASRFSEFSVSLPRIDPFPLWEIRVGNNDSLYVTP